MLDRLFRVDRSKHQSLRVRIRVPTLPSISPDQQPKAPLASAAAYDWTVTVWLSAPNVSEITITTTTGPATRFLTGFMDAAQWEGAEWLVAATPEAYLCRSSFALKAAPKRAVLIISGLGYFQATIVSTALAFVTIERVFS